MAHDRHGGARADDGTGLARRNERYGELFDRNVAELQDLAAERRIEGRSRMGKQELLEALSRGSG